RLISCSPSKENGWSPKASGSNSYRLFIVGLTFLKAALSQRFPIAPKTNEIARRKTLYLFSLRRVSGALNLAVGFSPRDGWRMFGGARARVEFNRRSREGKKIPPPRGLKTQGKIKGAANGGGAEQLLHVNLFWTVWARVDEELTGRGFPSLPP